MRKSQTSAGSRLLRAGIASAAAVVVVVAGAATPAFAVAATLTLSSTAGPAIGTNTIIASSTTAANYLLGVTSPVSTFSLSTCVATYTSAASSPVTPSSASSGNVIVVTTRKLTNTKASILVPALLVVPASTATSTAYKVCVYSSSTLNAPLVGSSTYTVAAAPVYPVVVAPASNASPSSGPSLGGSIITVTATSGLPTTVGSISATLGGTAMTSVTPVSATSFTAVTPAHAPGMVALSVTTAAGTQTLSQAYTYSNGISIAPNTASSATGSNPVYIDVLGAGFSGYVFGSVATKARVWLVDASGSGYDPGLTGVDTTYIQGPSAECVGVIVVSDNELVCNINLFNGALVDTTGLAASPTVVPNGTYTLTVVSNGDIAAADVVSPTYAVTDISSGSTFTVAPY
jgi:hypothetical protein